MWNTDYTVFLHKLCVHACSAAAAAKSHQSCSTLCDPIDGSLPGSPVPGILKARHACSVASNSLLSHGLWPTRFLCPWDSPGKNTGACCHFLLQSIFLIQGSNLNLLQRRQILHRWATKEAYL